MYKILCTLGPSTLEKKKIEELDRCGVDIFRINLSHTSLDNLESTIRLVKGSTDKAICLDSEGAQIRTYIMKGSVVNLMTGAVVKIHNEAIVGDEENLALTPFGVADSLEPGDIVNLDSNMVSVKVLEKCPDGVYAQVLSGGRVGTCKAVDVNREVDLRAVTPKDRQAFLMGRDHGLTHFALSFADSAPSVLEVRDIVGAGSFIISKIESRPGLRNLDSIIDHSQGILIDRGDLSRQVSIEKIPFCQAAIIARGNAKNTDVYVATNFIESMMTQPVPSKAEVNDLVSTILMGANGIVLAAETAVGAYPANCVRMVKNLLQMCGRWTPDSGFEQLLED